jgi:hypothetical protein
MLSVEQFKERIAHLNRSDWLRVVVDVNNDNQFYIVGNGGMGSTITAPIERFPPEIKDCVVSMINSGQLITEEKRDFLLDKNIWVYYLSYTQSDDVEA